MDNDAENLQNTPHDEAISQESSKFLSGSQIKEYGKKSLSPLIELVSKYRGEIVPYFDAIGRGLHGAAESLSGGESASQAAEGENFTTEQSFSESSGPKREKNNEFAREAERSIGAWFQEAADWFDGANQKLQSGNAKELMDYLDEKAKGHPAMMFSSSYIAGLVFGRIGRHLGRGYTKGPLDNSGQDMGAGSLKH